MEKNELVPYDPFTDVLIQIRLHCYMRFKLLDIIALQVKDKYVDIYLTSREKPLQVKGPLQELEKKLFPLYFCRTHKSCIIGVVHFKSMQEDTVLLSQRIELPLHASYREELIGRFRVLN